MKNAYKDIEKRKKYLKEWRLRNREHNNQYLKEYLKRTGKKYYKHKTKIQKNSTCGMGRKYEKKALIILGGAIDCNVENFRGKWDIEWNNFRIDVKSRNFSDAKNKTGWHFTTKNECSMVNYYLLFCLKSKKVVKILFIPQKIFRKGLFIGEKSKYNKYLLVLN